MATLVCAGAVLKCTMGTTPSVFGVLPVNQVLTGVPAATVLDNKPMTNVAPFGMCISPANPAVAAATAAALGVLTPMPCLPVTPAPWTPGSPAVLIGSAPALDALSRLSCSWGGLIQITSPGQLQASGL